MYSKTIVVMLLILIPSARAKNKSNSSIRPTTSSTTFNLAFWDGNEIQMPIINDGNFAGLYWDNYHLYSKGLKYGNVQYIYSSGFWLSALVNDSARAAISLFTMTDFTRGVLEKNGSHVGENDSLGFRVFKINSGDDARTNPDYADWPIEYGAPADENGNPLLIGDQTLWCTFTDAFYANRGLNFSPPLKAEIHLTTFGWRQLKNAVFLHWTIMNKSDKDWKDAFVGIFVDPDVDDASDDLVGSDSTLNMVYCYESAKGMEDKSLQSIGYQFIETPVNFFVGDTALTLWGPKSDYQNASALSPPIFKHSPREWVEYPFAPGKQTSIYVHDRLSCRDNNGDPLIDPRTGRKTNWAFSGDPLFQTGWLDSLPHDRRMMISAGPFDLSSGDTTGLTLAIIANKAANRFTSIIDLKQEAKKIQQAFHYQLKIIADVSISLEEVAEGQKKICIQTPLISQVKITQVRANLYDVAGRLRYSLDLLDDGASGDEAANDLIYGNIVEMPSYDEAWYLDLEIWDEAGKKYLFKRLAESIFLSNKLELSAFIVADHLNFDGKANPGEKVRLSLGAKNNYHFGISKLAFLPSTQDSLIKLKSYCLLMDSLSEGQSKSVVYDPQHEQGYFEFDVPADIDLNHKFVFDVDIYDEKFCHWQTQLVIPVDSLVVLPEEFKPTHIAGRSKAEFVIGMVDPTALKKHCYEIAVVDSINKAGDKGFDLTDKTTGAVLLKNHPAPDNYSFNVPITDGFKILKAYLPAGGLQNYFFEETQKGHDTGLYCDSTPGSSLLGDAPFLHYFEKIELEFTNEISPSGFVGEPQGQKAFRYELPDKNSPTGFFACPFVIWKIENGYPTGQLNVCFEEWPIFSSYDDLWGPNTSLVGGFETIYIMDSNYDESGSCFQNKKLNLANVLYKVKFYPKSSSSMVDIGDKFILEFELPASSEDRFAFVPTAIEQKSASSFSFSLLQNYPNPFNQSTTIIFTLTRETKVNLKIVNLIGQEIVLLVDGIKLAGNHRLLWDGKNNAGQLVSSGLYVAILQAEGQTKISKMLFIR